MAKGMFYRAFGQDAARRASAKPPEERTEYDKKILRLEQSRLAGQLNPAKDAALLAGLAHPAFSSILKQLDKGTEMGLATAVEGLLSLVAGTTVSGIARLQYDKMAGNVLRRAKVVQERGEKINGRFENLADYYIYHVFKEGLREVNIAKEGEDWIKRQRNQYKFPAASRLKELQRVSVKERDQKQIDGLLEAAREKTEFMRHRLAMFGGKKSTFKFPLAADYKFLKRVRNRTPEQEAYYQRVLEVLKEHKAVEKKLFPNNKPVKGLFQEDLDAYMQRLKGSRQFKKPVFGRQ
jgi:hypothetical protein